MTSRTLPRSLSIYSLAHINSPHNIHTSDPRHFARWFQDIEERVALQNLVCDVYVGAQFLSHLGACRASDAMLAKSVAKLWVFAQPDQPRIAGVNLVALSPVDALAKERFIVVNHPRYARLFVAHETCCRNDGGRCEEGILSSDRNLITQVETMLRQYLSHDSEARTQAKIMLV